jgi:Esterase PHB depolymerase
MRLIILTSACVAATTISAAGEETGALPSLNAAIEETSISGISSGAYMAVQFGTAWSSIVKGVGVIAGGPYYCAQAAASDWWNAYTVPVMMATGPCMRGPAPDLSVLIDEADKKAASAEIDPLSNLGRQKIYVFHGYNDSVVAEPVTDAAAEFYRHYLGRAGTGNLFYQKTLGAGHSQVLLLGRREKGPNDCSANQSPYINLCNYDQAGIILQFTYGALNSPAPGKLSGTIRSFAQAKYTAPDEPGQLSMGDEGFVYVPKDCEAGASCRVHIALHGCKQDAGDIDRLYVDDAGYNAWADANRIIVLYPQTAAKLANPKACWDWWSYIVHDDSYVTRSGRQITAIKSMLDALTAGRRPAPPGEAAQLAAPERLVVVDVTDTAAALAWTPVAGVETYDVFRADGGGPFAPVGGALGPSFADSGLQPSTSHRWRVTAAVGGAEGPPSPEASATTGSKPPPCGDPGACPLRPRKD